MDRRSDCETLGRDEICANWTSGCDADHRPVSTARAAAPSRQEVAVVRQPSATPVATSSATSCGSAARSCSTPAEGGQDHLGAARRRVRRHRARARSPATTRPGSRSRATSSSRSARRRCGPTAWCSRSPPTRPATTCWPSCRGSGGRGYAIALDGYDGRADIGELLALCSIVQRPRRGRAPTTCAAIAAPRRARRARCSWRPACGEPRGVRALPRPRVRLLPGRVLRQAAARAPAQRRPRRASARCAAVAELTARRADLRGPRAGHHRRRRALAEAPALRQLGVLRAAADDRLGARGADAAGRAHRAPVGAGHGHLLDPGRARRPGRARPAPRAHVREPRRQRAARGAREALHGRPVVGRRRAARHARWRRCSSSCRSPRRSRPRCCATRAPRASCSPP